MSRFIVKDIEWDIPMEEVFETFDFLTDEEAVEQLNAVLPDCKMTVKRYSLMSEEKRHDYFESAFRHAPGALYDMYNLPEEETVDEPSVEDEDVVDYLSDVYGWCINSCHVEEVKETVKEGK